MGIKLKTEVGNEPKMSMRYKWFRDLNGLAHDAAVAHARDKAISEANPIWRAWIDKRTAEVLRDDFGIDQE